MARGPDEVSFTKATTVILPAPVSGVPNEVDMHQIMARSMDGTVHVYDHGINTFPARPRFVMLSNTQKAALETWFRAEAQGMKETWTYTAEDGTTRTARFTVDSIAFEKVANNLWSVELPMELSAIGV